MVRVTLPIIIIAVVGYAFLIAVIILFLDKYLDLKVIAYTADASRQATNLLHSILTSGCTGAVEEKLVLDLYKLNSFESDKWSNCENLEYDYNFFVSVIDGDEPYLVVEKLVFETDNLCYLSYQRIKGYAEMPIVLYNDWENPPLDEPVYRPGIASLTLMKTPLSELAFWVSQASLRIKEGHDEGLLKSIRVGPEVRSMDVHVDEDGNVNEICMGVTGGDHVCKQVFMEHGVGFKVCKSKEIIEKDGVLNPGFECGDGGDIGIPFDNQQIRRDRCKIINIFANATENKVKIILPVS